MLIPVAFEYLMVSTFKGAKSLIVGTFKRAGSLAWSLVKFPFKALFAKREHKRESDRKESKLSTVEQKAVKEESPAPELTDTDDDP